MFIGLLIFFGGLSALGVIGFFMGNLSGGLFVAGHREHHTLRG